jgi:hypothetical protein
MGTEAAAGLGGEKAAVHLPGRGSREPSAAGHKGWAASLAKGGVVGGSRGFWGVGLSICGLQEGVVP